MALKGVSLAEREEFISRDDAGHPKNITAEVDKRIAAAMVGRKTALGDDKEAEIRKAVTSHDDFKPTQFYIGNLTRAQRIELGDMGATPTMKDGGITMSMQRTKRAYSLVQGALKGWDNMYDHEGAPAIFALGTSQVGTGFASSASDASMAHLSQELVHELAAAILDKNGMRTELEKNFEGASQPSADPLSMVGAAPTAPQNKN
jgi:hypothetical protein